ncbi:MAG: hypothetical protein P8I97_09300, partial [Verrucomicrobiales bacterium]|nr:hypothetical protein [Verrucomicrobiales bacterium]
MILAHWLVYVAVVPGNNENSEGSLVEENRRLVEAYEELDRKYEKLKDELSDLKQEYNELRLYSGEGSNEALHPLLREAIEKWEGEPQIRLKSYGQYLDEKLPALESWGAPDQLGSRVITSRGTVKYGQ